FTVMALRSGSPIHFANLAASGQKFYFNGPPTSSYCPLNPSECPTGDETVFSSDYSATTLGLYVEVPGGQQVYIGPDGAMSFTQAHSAYIPENSTQIGWSRVEDSPNYGTLSFEGGLVACPVAGKGYQVFGLLPNIDYDPQCLGFTAATLNATEVGAWQYT
ncbi:hypothetical protein BU16DRAFT_429576, partial [Lophium mytilinum]